MDEIYSRRPYLVDLLAAAVCQSVSCLCGSLYKCYASNLQNNPLLQEIKKPATAVRRENKPAQQNPSLFTWSSWNPNPNSKLVKNNGFWCLVLLAAQISFSSSLCTCPIFSCTNSPLLGNMSIYWPSLFVSPVYGSSHRSFIGFLCLKKKVYIAIHEWLWYKFILIFNFSKK